MIEAIVRSKISCRIIKDQFTARQILDDFMDEQDIVEYMTKCDCQPIGETNVVECNCEDEWEDYEFWIGEEAE